MKALWLLIGIWFFTGVGCAPQLMKSVSLTGENLPYRADPQDKDVVIYRNPQMRVTSYSQFLIEPVKIVSNDSLTIKPEEETLLAEMFRKELVSALEGGYEIVNKPGPRVLRIQIGIQDIQPAKVDLAEEGAVVLRLDTLLARVAMELDCLDSMSGDRVASLIHTLYDTRYFQREKKTRLLNIRDAFATWTKSLRKRFDAAKARTNGGFGEPDPEENRRLRFEEGE